MDVQSVEKECRSFLETYFGSHGGAASLKDNELRELGLRLVSLGNPERTVQGELVHFLRAVGLRAVSECGVTDDASRYSLDIVVFDEHWKEVCAIELKHYSANQGKVGALQLNMQADARRHQDGPQAKLPLIQIGIYTEIVHSFDKADSRPAFGLYRFLVTYFKGEPRQKIENQKLPEEFHGQLAAPSITQFELAGAKVAGRVGWIVRNVLAST
jgi:hypothetical protein